MKDGKTCTEIEQHIGGTINSESWRILKSLQKNKTEKIKIGQIKENEWQEYYKKLLTESRPQLKELERDGIEIYTHDEIELSLAEVQRTIKILKNKKAEGPGGIPNELIKNGSEKLFRMIHNMFERYEWRRLAGKMDISIYDINIS